MTTPFNPFVNTPIESPVVACLDIETLDTAITSTITSIGAVFFNLLTGQVYGRFYERVSHHEQARSKNAETQAFWQQQAIDSPLAYAELFDTTKTRTMLSFALDLFNDKVAEMQQHPDAIGGTVHVIGNGCDFDNAIVCHAMAQYNMKPAWRFRDNDHLRSFVYMGRLLLGVDPKYNLPFEGIKHHALHDAQHEADYLLAVMREFMQRLNIAPAIAA